MRDTQKDQRVRAARKLMEQAAIVLRRRTGQAIAAASVDDTLAVPSQHRYEVAALLEALAHERDLKPWTLEQAVTLSRSILAEDNPVEV